MNMENKYYVPELSEFRVGFEVEGRYNIKSDWEKVVLGVDDFEVIFDDYEHEMDGKFSDLYRVKCLDREDVEELGWELEESLYKDACHLGSPVYKIVNNGTFLLINNPYGTGVTIKMPNLYRDGSGNYDGYYILVYRMKIRNKTELRDVMRMLGIEAKKPSGLG